MFAAPPTPSLEHASVSADASCIARILARGSGVFFLVCQIEAQGTIHHQEAEPRVAPVPGHAHVRGQQIHLQLHLPDFNLV